jgi:hypothetical protein
VILGCGCPLTGRTVPCPSASQWQPGCPSERSCMRPSRRRLASPAAGTSHPALRPGGLAEAGRPP